MTRLVRTLARLLLVGSLLTVSGCSVIQDDTITITAMLRDAAGLFEGNDVGVLGHPVGTIQEIEPAGAYVRVTMTVTGQPIPADAHAVVVSRSVATDRYLELTPVYDGTGPKMQDGDVIPVERTGSPVGFDEVLETLHRFATNIAGSKQTTRAIERLLDAGVSALEGKGDLIHETLTSLDDAAQAVAGQREEFAAALEAVNVLVSKIARHERTTRKFIRQVSRASQLLASQRDDLRRALDALDRAVRVVSEFARKHRAEITRALESATAVMRNVLRDRKKLAEILQVMPVALENIRRAVHDGELRVRLTPMALIPLKDQLSRLCHQLAPKLCDSFGLDPTVLEELLGGPQ